MDYIQISDLVGKVVAKRANKSEYSALLDELRIYGSDLEDNRTKMTFQLTDELRLSISQTAINQGTNDSELVRRAIDVFIGLFNGSLTEAQAAKVALDEKRKGE